MHQIPQKLIAFTAMMSLVLSSFVTLTHFHADGECSHSVSAQTCSHSHNPLPRVPGLENVPLGDCGHDHSQDHQTPQVPGSPDKDHCSLCRMVLESAADFDFAVELAFSDYAHQLCAEVNEFDSLDFVSLYLSRGPPSA